MSFVLASLPPLRHSSPSHLSRKLQDLRPLFFVPSLEDRPQDPIVEALQQVPLPDLVRQYEDVIKAQGGNEVRELREVDVVDKDEDLWTGERVSAERNKRKNQNLSWDALRTTFLKQPTSTPFLSEQSNDVFDAVRHHVRPRLDDPTLQLRYILPTVLLELLTVNMLGNSSPLYVWHTENERFVPPGVRQDMTQVVIIEGLDDVASASIIQRFLTIGTLMRRMETFVISLQRRNNSPTMHAFLHALSTVLVHMHTSLRHQPPYSTARLISLWLHYAENEAILSSLASLCRRVRYQAYRTMHHAVLTQLLTIYLLQADSRDPPYEPLPDSPADLLSHVYEHLERHIENQSPRIITAMLAFILTTSSRDYFTSLGESLGLYELSRTPWLRTGAPFRSGRHRANDVLQLDDVDFDQSSLFSDDEHLNNIPTFIPSELVDALPAARKSLRILQAADPDHHLGSAPAVTICEWVWSCLEVEQLWETQETSRCVYNVPEGPENRLSVAPGTPNKEYMPGLEQFRLFDLEPGAHLAETTPPGGFRAPLSSFLAAFPARLPPLTPTLQHLATAVLQPVFMRTEILSSSLLKLYLTSLHLETHLTLLRSYMLLTLPSFKVRLVEALFSEDTEVFRHVGRGTRLRTRARLGIRDERDAAEANPSMGLGIGLGRGLTEQDAWPPWGADLGFFLRSVIVDSLEERTNENEDADAEKVWRESEVRLGFALRDLPIGDGRDRWLNPMSIEALDFLYLDYKPPPPLDVVITPEVLSKYQRIFTFLLRLLRTETVARIAFRSTLKSGGPVFPYAPLAQDLLVRLRFQIQALVTALVTYVFDSAIGGNFDTYMRRIAELRDGFVVESLERDKSDHGVTDVFSLAESHSNLLDRILSGCLLRTVQRTAGDALSSLLELVLKFGILLMNVRRGLVQEAQGADDLRELYEAFQQQMLLFVNAVQAQHAKGQASSDQGAVPEYSIRHAGFRPGHPWGHHSHLEDLLVRIDPTGWWKRKLEQQTKRAV